MANVGGSDRQRHQVDLSQSSATLPAALSEIAVLFAQRSSAQRSTIIAPWDDHVAFGCCRVHYQLPLPSAHIGDTHAAFKLLVGDSPSATCPCFELRWSDHLGCEHHSPRSTVILDRLVCGESETCSPFLV